MPALQSYHRNAKNPNLLAMALVATTYTPLNDNQGNPIPKNWVCNLQDGRIAILCCCLGSGDITVGVSTGPSANKDDALFGLVAYFDQSRPNGPSPTTAQIVAQANAATTVDGESMDFSIIE